MIKTQSKKQRVHYIYIGYRDSIAYVLIITINTNHCAHYTWIKHFFQNIKKNTEQLTITHWAL